MIVRPQLWEFSPALSKRPNLWRDLAFCYIFVNGVAVDVARKSTYVSANLSPGVYSAGEGADFSGRFEPGGRPLQPGSGGITLCTIANPAASGNSTSLVTQRVANRNKHIELRGNADIAGASSGSIVFYLNNGSIGGDVGGAYANGVIDGAFHCFAGRRLGVACSLWVDGEDRTTGSTPTTNDMNSSSATFVVGGLPGTTVIHYIEDMLLSAGWNRELSDAEMRDWGTMPFAMLEPAERTPMFAFPVGGSLPELVGEDSIVVVQSDSGTLVQTHALAPIDSTVVVASSTGVVTTSVNLIAEESAVMVVSDSAVVAQTHLLAGEDSAVLVAADPGALSQTHLLVPGDSAVVVQSDEGAVSSALTLAGEATSVVVQSDAGVIAQTHVLAPEESTVVVSNGPGVVGQVHVLAPAESAVEVTSEDGSVSSALTLAGESSAVLVVTAPGAIDQTHSIAGQPTAVPVTSDSGTLTQTHGLTPGDSVVLVQSDPGVVFQQSLGAVIQPHVEILPGYQVEALRTLRQIRVL